MQIGDELTVEPADLVAGGAALARVDGFPLFVTGIYPGDLARVRVTEVKAGFGRADLVNLERSSPLRRTAPCPIAGECGGCDWTALRLDAQLLAKRRILEESLRRVGKLDPSSLPPIALHPSPLNYRLRSRLHREGDAIGFYAMRSNHVVQLARECEVVGPETARVFGGSRPATPEPARDETVWEVDRRITTRGDLTIAGYHLTAGAFFQVNRHLLEMLLGRVGEIAAAAGTKRSAVDLYSGVGFFSRPLASVFERVTAIEGSRESHDCAKRNASPNVKLVNAPVEAWIPHMPRTDFVFLDPPRSGAKRNVIDAIAKKTNEIICFLACDPVTFARDASRLIASGWILSTLDLVDLFPNTHHVETLSSFRRAP